MPKVSVLMTFHRVTPFLEPAVRSALDQTERDFELMLVDNGTGAGLEPLGATGRDPRIRLVSFPVNRGIAPGINRAAAEARGEFCAVLDYDDIALPTRLEKQVALLRARPELGMVSSAADTIDERGRVVGREFSLAADRDQAVYTQFAMPVVHPAYSGRREVFLRHPYRPEYRVCADFDALARMAETVPMAGVPEVLLHYRRYAGQTSEAGRRVREFEICVIRLLTARRRAGREEQFEALLAEYRRWRDDPPPLDELYTAFARRFLAEGFGVAAAYHARRLLAVRRDPAACGRAAAIVAAALRAEPRRAGLLLRVFLTGPVRAFGLKPAGKSAGARAAG